MEQRDTKKVILDAAEHLFAGQGFRGASMRRITGLAGVNLAAVNYHFGSKDALLDAVLERRLLPLNKERMERLSQVKADADGEKRRPRVRDVISAFVEPTLRFKDSGPGAEDFISLVGQALSGEDNTVRRVFFRMIAPLFLHIFDLLREALPEMPEGLLLWRLNFTFGALSHTMRICAKSVHGDFTASAGEEERASQMQMLCAGARTEDLITMLTSFVSAGMEAP